MKSTLIAAVAATGLLATGASAITIQDVFTSYYAFGDSLTDDGKFGNVPAGSPGAVFEPSNDGRFTDGITYAEDIAAVFEDANLDTGNLALGGATAGNVNSTPAGPLSTFAGQIGTLFNAITNGLALPTTVDFTETQDAAPTPGSNPLVSVFFGGNDIFQAGDRAEEALLAGTISAAEIPAFVQGVVTSAADSVTDGIRALALGSGGLFNDFLVLDLPDVGAAPAFTNPRFFAPGTFDPTASFVATQLTTAFNDQLATNIGLLQDEIDGLNIISFDTSATFDIISDDIAAGGQQFGITIDDDACTLSFSLPGEVCDDPSIFAFADGVHPTGVVHEILGDATLSTLQQSVAAVPLPAGLPLMLLGLGAMVGLRRRAA